MKSLHIGSVPLLELTLKAFLKLPVAELTFTEIADKLAIIKHIELLLLNNKG